MEEWSLISYQMFSKLIRHYRRKLLSSWQKDIGKSINKRVQIIVANVFWRKTFTSICDFPSHFQFFYLNLRFVLAIF